VAVIGIDGYPSGWVAARVDPRSRDITWSTSDVGGISTLLDPACIIGVDMPIGLVERGWRECDLAARSALGRAGSRVFLTPPRAVLELGIAAPNDDVQHMSRLLTGQGTSRQAMGLAERILVLDNALTHASSDRHATVLEVHPELAFAEMTGQVLASKKSAAGVGQRIAALGAWLDDVGRALASAPHDVPVDDALDALAAAWSAARWRDGRARTLPPSATEPPFIVV